MDSLRAQTLAEQKLRDERRLARDKLIEERVKAAKNRQRARQGLPPLDENELKTKENVDDDLYDKSEERELKRLEEKMKVLKEKEEKIREEERKRHIRPWDKNKTKSDNIVEEEWHYVKEKRPKMTQSEWNEMKRSERNKEFAPVYEKSTNEFRRRNFDIKENKNKIENPIPIQNEMSEDETDDDDNDDKKQGIEIPPPPTYEYYGPSSSGKRFKSNNNKNLEDSIEAGLKFLRNQSDKNASSGGKRVWTSKADY